VVVSLEDRSGNGDMSGVLHIVGSSHVGVITLHDGAVLRIAKGVLDPASQVTARNWIGVFVALAEHRYSKRKQHESYNHKSRLHYGIFLLIRMCFTECQD
jgi:hypothetical protein